MISLRILGLIRRDDEILMVKPRAGPEPNVWDLPGGGIHFREPHIEALTREIREEVGLHVKAEDSPLVVSDFIPREDESRHSVNIVFECVPLDSHEPSNLEPDKLSEVRWLTPEAADKEGCSQRARDALRAAGLLP